MTQVMNEYQRQAYLTALGLEQYVPRWRLPLAPEPVECELPVLLEPEPAAQAQSRPAARSTSSAAPEPDSAPASSPQPLADVLRDMSAPPKSSKTGRAEQPRPLVTPIAEQERLSPFSLSIWRSSLPLLVLDARQPRSAMPTERLLHNILVAMAPPNTDTRIQEEILPWPSVNNPALQLRVADARAELHTWLEMELSERPVQHLLLMGENAARHFLPEEAEYAQLMWQSVTLAPFGRPALVAPSLVELLQQPLLKRDLWRALQPLRTPS